MATANPIKTTHMARLSKLKSKRQQLEQLLRKKARLDFEIRTLKRSISKEQKQALKENLNLEKPNSNQPREVYLTESLELAESEDPEEALVTLYEIDKELNSILQLLLDYNEPVS